MSMCERITEDVKRTRSPSPRRSAIAVSSQLDSIPKICIRTSLFLTIVAGTIRKQYINTTVSERPMQYTEQTFELPELRGLSARQIEAHLKLYSGYVKNV